MKKILIIEDDPAILHGLQELLQFENYSVISCSDGQKGVETALQKHPDLVILDANLPSLSGFEVCRILRESMFLNPIIMLTSRSEQVDRIVGLELGANDYVTKPFDSRELLARIHSQLRSIERMAFYKEKHKTSGNDKSIRRLLAVMFTDMKDYSKKMNIDEKLALNLLEIHNNMVKEIIKIYEGKVIEIIGDAFVITFKSAVKSVECAHEIQKNFRLYNLAKIPDEQILIRIGIHLGDIIKHKDNIKGDAVNIAARIQQNAVPGGVTFSESVYTAVKNKVNFKMALLGEYNFKNIKEPVKLYSLD